MAAKNSPGVGMVTDSESTAAFICSLESGSAAVKNPVERRTAAVMALRNDMQKLLHRSPADCQRHSKSFENPGDFQPGGARFSREKSGLSFMHPLRLK